MPDDWRGRSRKAVSYTHLDVYKRQEDIHYDKHQDKCFDQRLQHFMDRSEKEVVGIHGDVQLQSGRPVSYTHLDVYKRQVDTLNDTQE